VSGQLWGEESTERGEGSGSEVRYDEGGRIARRGSHSKDTP